MLLAPAALPALVARATGIALADGGHADLTMLLPAVLDGRMVSVDGDAGDVVLQEEER